MHKRHIRDSLRRYPAGSGIIKELLQNSDDARASAFKCVFDKRRHSSPQSESGTKFLTPEMEQFLARPSLLVYDNGGMKERDLKSILSLEGSQKTGSLTKGDLV